MEKPNLNYLLGLEPTEIIEWYKSKGYAITWNWDDLWQQSHSRSFTVAKILKLDLLQSIRSNWIKAQSEGLTYVEWRRRIEGRLKEEGWWGKQRVQDVPGYWDLSLEEREKLGDPEAIVQLGSAHRLKTIYNTNANIGYNTARYNAQMDNKNDRPYLQYIQIQRGSKRDSHAVFHNKIFHIDDPIWDTIYPPSDFNCGCYTRSLTLGDVKESDFEIEKGKEFETVANSKIKEGWKYNPAKEQYTPDRKEYDRDLFGVFKKELRVSP